MRRFLAQLAVVITLVALACGGGLSEDVPGNEGDLSVNSIGVRGSIAAARATPAPAATAAPAAAGAAVAEGGSHISSGALQTAQRKVISSASITVELKNISEATSQVRVIAESLGGFVEQLSSSGGPQRQRATMTIRVPQDHFFPALERIEALGTVQSRNIGSEDVSEQFIDLEARLKSALGEEQSLLSLLERAGTVSEVLAIERELFRVRSEIERFQGQLNFLERRVDLATISISLVSPEVRAGEPPSASLFIDVSDVSDTVARVKALAETLNGVVEEVFLSQRDGREEANFVLRVFTSEFDRAVDFLEDQGKVRSKELREGTTPPDQTVTASEEPDSVIGVFLLAKEGSNNTTLIAAIAAPLGAIALAAVLGFLLLWVYRSGRRRGRTA